MRAFCSGTKRNGGLGCRKVTEMKKINGFFVHPLLVTVPLLLGALIAFYCAGLLLEDGENGFAAFLGLVAGVVILAIGFVFMRIFLSIGTHKCTECGSFWKPEGCKET